MKNPNLAFRKAIVSAIDNIDFKNGKVRTFEEQLLETSSKKKLVVSGVEYYIILLNQTSNDLSAKCIRNDEVSIQIQITSVFPNNKGGSQDAELISDLVMTRLFSNDGLNGIIPTPNDFELWKLDQEGIVNITFDSENTKTWIVQLLVTGQMTQ